MSNALNRAAAMSALGIARPVDLVRAGAIAMEADGCESPSIAVLAGLTPAELDRSQEVFDRALSELEIPPVSRRDAVTYLAAEVAKGILDGSIGAYEGSRRIWELTLELPEERFPELDAFVYGASEWDERPGDRNVFQEGILVAARDLLRAHGTSDGT